MLTRERPWTATIVCSSEHAGLKPEFKRLEDALYGCLSEIDDPVHVRDWLRDQVVVLKIERGRLKQLSSLNRRQGSRGLR